MLPRSKQLKKSKLLLNVNKLKNFLQKKVYVHKFNNENYQFWCKKHMLPSFNLKFHMTVMNNARLQLANQNNVL